MRFAVGGFVQLHMPAQIECGLLRRKTEEAERKVQAIVIKKHGGPGSSSDRAAS